MADEPKQPVTPGIDPERMGASFEKEKEATEKMLNADKPEKKAPQTAEEFNRKEKYRKVGIRTYRDYASDELRKGGATLTKMIIKEREKEREQKRHSVKNTKNMFIILLSSAFVVLGIGILILSFFLVSQKKAELDEKNSIIVTPDPLIINDFRNEEYIADPTRAKINRAFANQQDDTSIPAGSIKHIYITQDNADGFKELATTEDFLTAAQTRVPGTLLRTLRPNYMYGLYSSTENAPFLLFEIGSFSTAFAGMLEWEETLLRDMEPIFVRDYGSSTRMVFQDIVLYNNDVRAILNDQGEVIFGYSFLQDKESLLIFENKLTLREIVTRKQQNTIRE